MPEVKVIRKKLSPNDVGETGSHQAGILIPKKIAEDLDFFPKINKKKIKNPRKTLEFFDRNGKKWLFNYIYYNNKYFDGTRDEYRLTGMTNFIEINNLKSDDHLIISKGRNNHFLIDFCESEKNLKFIKNKNTGKSSWNISNSDQKEKKDRANMLDVKEIQPDPERVIISLRDTGYKFETAVEDIIDNSIAAGADIIKIDKTLEMDGSKAIYIADNGCGMNDELIEEAMKYGSCDDPRRVINLGKFGLGLKTASTAFCKRLSVVSRCNSDDNFIKATWDLDHVAEVNKWEVFFDEPESEEIERIFDIAPDGIGTLVIWEKIDRLLKEYAEPGGTWAQRAFNEEMDKLSEHAGMVYHKFIDNVNEDIPNIEIFIDGEKVDPWNPFFPDISDQALDTELEFEFSDGSIEQIPLRAYILPRRQDIDDDDLRRKTKITTDNQGIYVYRENRLIHGPDWLGYWKQEPHVSLLRVEFLFGEELDDQFQIDIKKSQIIPPDKLKEQIMEALTPARREAENRYRHGYREDQVQTDDDMHGSSNIAIGEKAGQVVEAKVTQIDDDTARVENPEGRTIINISSSTPSTPGQLHVKPVDDIVDGLLWEPTIIKGNIGFRINRTHDYYSKVYLPNKNQSVVIQGLDSLIWAISHAEMRTVNDMNERYFKDMRYSVSRVLRRLVEDMPEPVEEEIED